MRFLQSLRTREILPRAGVALVATLAFGPIGCGPSQAEVQQQIEQAKQAQARAAAAEEAARQAKIAAEQATAAADQALKSVHEASVEIDRVAKHLDELQQDDVGEQGSQP